jgi:hypothetical protein
MVHGALRVPATVAPLKITADLRAGLVRCAVTVTAPREGRPTTRVNWLMRQLKNGPGQLCIEASSAWQHGKGPARTLDQAREDPKTLIGDPGHELRAFTLSLTSNAGPARGQGHGSFVNSVLAAVDTFYAEVVQHIKPWAPAPPKVKDDEPTPSIASPINDGLRAEPSVKDEGDPREEHAGLIPGRPLLQLAEAKSPLGHPPAYPGENCTVIELRRPAG